jgi:hypothetical protein
MGHPMPPLLELGAPVSGKRLSHSSAGAQHESGLVADGKWQMATNRIFSPCAFSKLLLSGMLPFPTADKNSSSS